MLEPHKDESPVSRSGFAGVVDSIGIGGRPRTAGRFLLSLGLGIPSVFSMLFPFSQNFFLFSRFFPGKNIIH
jgi:hypothetical protein